MANVGDLLNRLAVEAPDYWAWLQTHPNALTKVKNLAQEHAGGPAGQVSGQRWEGFFGAVTALKSFTTFATGVAPDDEAVPPEDVLPGFGEVTPPAEPTGDPNADIRAVLQQFLIDNELPVSLMGFIESALAQKKPYAQIIAELRETPEYKAAYPENDMRRSLGFDWIPESQIRSYRSEARRLAESYLGISVSDGEISKLLANNKSLAEWERTLQTWEDFERWGPTARAVLEQELGHTITDDRLFAFMAPFIPTPELDRAYEMALLRARPAVLGIGVRPEEEAEILRQYGISVADAFRGYQGIVGELPRAERFAAIEAEINRNAEQFPTGSELFGGTPFAELFRAIQLGDPESIARLQAQLSREVARFQAGGGPAAGGAGLLSPAERATL